MGNVTWHFEKDDRMGDVIVLDTPLVFSYKGKSYTIPEGFRSDGMSVPRFFWRMLSPKYDPVTLLPSLIHDYLYTLRIGTRKEADRFYEQLLRSNGYPAWKAKLVYAGVRIGGGSHW